MARRTRAGLLGLVIVAILATVATRELYGSLDVFPSMKVRVTCKRPQQFFGKDNFVFFANPVVSTNEAKVLYDGYATIENDGKIVTYIYVNGTGYVIRSDTDVQCLSSLPFYSIVSALNNATFISRAIIDGKLIVCTSGNLFKTVFAGAEVAICAFGASGFTAYSKECTLNVEYLTNHVLLPTIKVPSCKMLGTPVSVLPIGKALLTGTAFPLRNTRHLEATQNEDVEETSCQCKSTPRPCIFFHGASSPNEMEELQNTPINASGRIGNMNDHAPCCSTVKYAILNTLNFSWTDDLLQTKFCDRALRFSNGNATIITNTVIVTYSFSGLAIAMAVATGKCSFGSGSTWVALGTPMIGTLAADRYAEKCTDQTGSFLTKLFYLFDECPVTAGRESVFYESGAHTTLERRRAYAMAQKAYRDNVDAVLCGIKPGGIISKYQLPMYLLAKMWRHQSPWNDGTVEFQSCAKGLDHAQFGSSYRDRFYKASINHADVGFLTHDAWFDESQKPKKWFECLL